MKVEDLEVYRRLAGLAICVHDLTMKFPKFELYELGSQLRRSSNSAPANLAEGFSNKHTGVYTECISRAQGEIRETTHHLHIAQRKGYLSAAELRQFIIEHERCSKMLFRLEQAFNSKKQ